MHTTPLFGAIEAGGTKILCGLANAQGHWLDRRSFATASPQQAIADISSFFGGYTLSGLGLASFGPLDLNTGSPHYGGLLKTTKAGWSGFAFKAELETRLGVPLAISTDVLGAALAEWQMGAARGCDNFCYVTVGTGIGVGVYQQGQPLLGANHPEPGHLSLTRAEGDHDFISQCCFHSHCAEGLASGPALSARAGAPLATLADRHPIWPLACHYLAQLCHLLVLGYAPERIVLGGGVLQKAGLLEALRCQFRATDTGMCDFDADQLLVSALDNQAGLQGALLLARQSHHLNQVRTQQTQ